MPSDELEPLRVASKGLLYPSDTDAPFDLVTLPSVPAGAKTVELDVFFGELAGGDDAKKFSALHQAVTATLSGAKVYRVPGKDAIDVYVLGRTASGAIGGLHTTSVET